MTLTEPCLISGFSLTELVVSHELVETASILLAEFFDKPKLSLQAGVLLTPKSSPALTVLHTGSLEPNFKLTSRLRVYASSPTTKADPTNDMAESIDATLASTPSTGDIFN